MEFLEPFLDRLLDNEGWKQATAKAVTMIRSLVKSGIAKETGIFSSEPGDPSSIGVLTVIPVFHVVDSLDLDDVEDLKRLTESFNKVIVLVTGENGYLTTVTVRFQVRITEGKPQRVWEAIRVGRSHLVQAFERLNKLFLENRRISIDGAEIVPQEQLIYLPFCALWVPDSRQFFLAFEVMGSKIKFLLFPVYDNTGLGEAMRPMTLEALSGAVAQAAEDDTFPFADA